MVGICSYGGYIPRYRLDRSAVYQALGWMNPGNIANARGEKAVANFDEDSITMAVAAGLEALSGMDRSTVEGMYLASTTMPYKERLNAGIVSAALGLNDNIRATDFSGSLKAGTSALLSALDGVEAKRLNNIVVAVSESRLGKPASPQELIFGDAAAALVVGDQDVIAEFKGSYSITYDFADHYRGQSAKYDRQWEDRWIRDFGFDQFIPEVVNGLLSKFSLKIEDFSKVIYDCHYPAARKKLNKILGIVSEADQGNFQAEIGQSGSAQSLVMLVNALEEAKAGDKVLVVSFGSGCDALYFEVTEHINNKAKTKGISEYLANKAELDNYTKYLVWRNILPADAGLRAEEDVWTRWSALWRSRKTVLGLWGTKCTKCGTVHIPPQRVCVNAECGAIGDMEDYCFADKIGHIASFTGDMLAASLNPPAIYGQIEFDGGGKMMFDLTDCDLDELSTGMSVSMSFRRKYYDEKRDISGYFWKAVPMKEVKYIATGIKDKVAIIGMGCTRFGERWESYAEDLAAEAFVECLEDAGIEKKDLQAAYIGTHIDEINVGKAAVPLGVALKLPYIPVTRAENYCATATEAFRAACYSVAAGVYDIVLALGVEKLKDTGYGGLPASVGMGVQQFMISANMTAPGMFAQLATAYSAKWGISMEKIKDAMAHVSAKSHANGALNPKAHLRKAVTEEQIKAAPMIAYPLGLFDCCGVSDGAACAIITTPEIAKDLKKNQNIVKVKALAVSVSSGEEAMGNSWDGAHFVTTRIAATKAYEEAGIKDPRDELSMCEVHDCFSITEMVTMEDLHISPKGGAYEDVMGGFYDLDGQVPCQVDGGLKCFGHPIGASGLRMMYAMYEQLLERVPEDRKVKNPRLGLTHNLGGMPHQNVAAIAILGID